MDWSNERYVRVYTRDTTTWKLMDWRARTVLLHLVRKVDRAGVLDVGHDGVLGLAAVIELPLDIVEPGIAQLTTSRGGIPTVVDTGTAYVLPNFMPAQEAPQSDPQRKRESRARRRDRALAVSRNLLLAAGSGADADQDRDETGQDRDENADEVTPILIRSYPDPIPDQKLSLPRDPAVPAPGAHAQPPAPDPKLDEIVQPAPVLVHRPTTTTLDEIDRESRRRVQLEVRAELERERREVATELGVADHGLLAQDPGERELAAHLVAAGPAGLAAARSQALHAIAMAGLEARKKRELRWLTGAIFGERNFRRLVAMTAAEAKRVEPGKKGDPQPQARRPDPGPAPIELKQTAAELAELSAMANIVASMPTAELVKRFGDGARAPPSSAAPTITDDERKPGKAHTT